MQTLTQRWARWPVAGLSGALACATVVGYARPAMARVEQCGLHSTNKPGSTELLDLQKRLYGEGLKAITENPTQAVLLLRQAEQLISCIPTVILKLGEAYEAAGDYANAYVMYGRIKDLRYPPTKYFEDWLLAIDSARSNWLSLRPRLGITVSGAPPRMIRVLVDGRPLTTHRERLDEPEWLGDPEEHQIRAEADGFDAAERTVEVTPGRKPTEVELQLKERLAGPANGGEALRLAREGNWKGALEALERERAKSEAEFLFNIAFCHEMLSKEAAESTPNANHATQAWYYFGKIVEKSLRERAQWHIEQLAPKVVATRVSVPGGAEVFIDSRPLRLASRVDGKATLVAGFASSGTAPPNPLPEDFTLMLDRGAHDVLVRKPKHSDWRLHFDATPGNPLQFGVGDPINDEPPARRIVGATLAGVGVAGALVGLGIFLDAQSQLGDAEDDEGLCPNKLCTDRGEREVRDVETKADLATGLGVAGAAAVVLGALVLWAPWESSPKHPRTGSNRAAFASDRDLKVSW